MMTTRIANATSSDIEAKVTINKEYLLSKLISKNEGEKFGPFSLNFGFRKGESFLHFYQHPGFVRIAPGDYLAFNISGDDGKVFVSIKSESNDIAENFPVNNNQSVIADEKGCLQLTKTGTIWTDTKGRDHSN